MNDRSKRRGMSAPATTGARVRLAESPIGAVDVCDCGVWQLHVGALSLRLNACAVSERMALLGRAIAEHSTRKLPDGNSGPIAFFRNPRGDA